MRCGSTLYDYTRSAEELRQFELRERCIDISMEYERFNLENDVYKMFGEWLLEQAKTKYSAKFTSCDLLDYLESKELSLPRSFDIESEYEDQNDCKQFRMICSGRRLDSSNSFKSDYGIYTLWKIAQAYNCKNGCVVVRIIPGVEILLDWSKDAQDCITRKKWREKAEDNEKLRDWFVHGIKLGFGFGSFFVAVLIILGVVGIIGVLCVAALSVFAGGLIGVILLRKLKIEHNTDNYAYSFDLHCKSIQDAKQSEYGINRTYNCIW